MATNVLVRNPAIRCRQLAFKTDARPQNKRKGDTDAKIRQCQIVISIPNSTLPAMPMRIGL